MPPSELSSYFRIKESAWDSASALSSSLDMSKSSNCLHRERRRASSPLSRSPSPFSSPPPKINLSPRTSFNSKPSTARFTGVSKPKFFISQERGKPFLARFDVVELVFCDQLGGNLM